MELNILLHDTRYRYLALILLALWPNPSFRMQQSQNERKKTSSSNPTTTQDGDNDKNNNSSNLINRGRPIVPIDTTTKSPTEPTPSGAHHPHPPRPEHATATATTDNRSSTTTIANSKMTPQSPSLHSSDPSEFDEFAAVPPTDPNITELSSGEVEVAVVSTSEAEQSTISLGDVDASRISAGSHSHTVVIPNAPVSRNLTDAFENCEGVLSTPSSTTSAAGDANAGGVEGDAGDGSSPAGIEELYIEGLSIKSPGNAKAKQHQKKRSGSVLKTPGVAAQATPSKTCPSPKITVLGEAIPFSLHPVLALDLPAPTVNRVSFYCIIHDINKESSDMASNDPSSADAGRRRRSSSLSCNSAAGSVSTISVASSNVGEHPVNEEFSPLIMAVNGSPSGVPLTQTMSKLSTATTAASSTLSASSSAIIDEEKWLLRAISSRSVSEVENTRGSCPTFAQAIGEQDSVAADDNSSAGVSRQAPNPMTDLSQSRTQLWKPSRSWWEAKSGKNPWIEPNSHNKRWR